MMIYVPLFMFALVAIIAILGEFFITDEIRDKYAAQIVLEQNISLLKQHNKFVFLLTEHDIKKYKYENYQDQIYLSNCAKKLKMKIDNEIQVLSIRNINEINDQYTYKIFNGKYIFDQKRFHSNCKKSKKNYIGFEAYDQFELPDSMKNDPINK